MANSLIALQVSFMVQTSCRATDNKMSPHTTETVLFIADKWNTLDHARDTTLHLAKTAEDEFGMRCLWTTPQHVYFENGSMYAEIQGELNSSRDPEDRLQKPSTTDEIRALRSFHSIHWRADPPVQLETFRLWSLLDATQGNEHTKLVNHPRALLTWNEKFSAHKYPEWAIPSLIANHSAAWERFIKARKDLKLIAKPSGEAASRGVTILPRDLNEAKAALLKLQAECGPWIVIQEFAPEITSMGETRAFIMGGQIVGSLNKKPKPGVAILNLDLPADQQPELKICTLTSEQQTRALKIAQDLKTSGVHLASIDFIGGRILEINVTSVGLLKWYDAQSTEYNLSRTYWSSL